jgi:hypothetical protein
LRLSAHIDCAADFAAGVRAGVSEVQAGPSHQAD